MLVHVELGCASIFRNRSVTTPYPKSLSTRHTCIWAFCRIRYFTNNAAEQTGWEYQRSYKCQGCFHTEHGGTYCWQIVSYLTSMIASGHNPLTAIQTTFQDSTAAAFEHSTKKPITMRASSYIIFLISTSVCFVLLGFIVGVRAENFELLQVAPLIFVTPLLILGRSFYWLTALPPFCQTVSLFDPII